MRFSRSARSGSSRQARLGANSTVDRLGVDEAGRADPDRVDVVVAAQLGDEVLDVALDRLRVRGRRLPAGGGQDRALLVDHSAGDLGAAHVDPDRQSHQSSSHSSSSLRSIFSTAPSRRGAAPGRARAWPARRPRPASASVAAVVRCCLHLRAGVRAPPRSPGTPGSSVHVGAAGRDVLVDLVHRGGRALGGRGRRSGVLAAALLGPVLQRVQQLGGLLGDRARRARRRGRRSLARSPRPARNRTRSAPSSMRAPATVVPGRALRAARAAGGRNPRSPRARLHVVPGRCRTWPQTVVRSAASAPSGCGRRSSGPRPSAARAGRRRRTPPRRRPPARPPRPARRAGTTSARSAAR